MKVQIPETWSDITLKQFQIYTSEMRKDINQTSSFCDIKFADAVKMKITDVKKLTNDIAALLKIVPDSLVMMFEFNGTKYGFIPKFDDITIGEYADLEFYLSDTDKMWDNMHRGGITNDYAKLYPKGGEGTDDKDIEKDEWGWFRIIYHFAGGDITRFDEVERQQLILALNTLSYEQDKNREEQQQLNRIK